MPVETSWDKEHLLLLSHGTVSHLVENYTVAPTREIFKAGASASTLVHFDKKKEIGRCERNGFTVLWW